MRYWFNSEPIQAPWSSVNRKILDSDWLSAAFISCLIWLTKSYWYSIKYQLTICTHPATCNSNCGARIFSNEESEEWLEILSRQRHSQHAAKDNSQWLFIWCIWSPESYSTLVVRVNKWFQGRRWRVLLSVPLGRTLKKAHALQALDSPVAFSPQKRNSHWNKENKLLRASTCASWCIIKPHTREPATVTC